MTTDPIEGEIIDEGSTPGTGLALEAQTRGEIDIQIVTARRFPRNLTTFKKTALEMATLDEETAESCLYALPRGGKTIDGPSVRLAEVIAAAYQHMRVEGRIVSIDEKTVTARGTAWDIQNNVAIAVEVQRRITGKDGKRYNEDMVSVACNAATAIASRNAILKTVPKAYWQTIYLACRKVVAGDAQTLSSRRQAMLDHFLKLGVPNDRVFEAIDVKGTDDITLDHLVTLKGVAAAIKNGEVTVEGAFDSIEGENHVPQQDPVDTFLAALPAEEQAEIKALIVASKKTKGQVTSLLKKHANDPKGFKAALQATKTESKPAATKDEKADKTTAPPAKKDAAAPAAAEVFKEPTRKPSTDDEAESL